MTGCLDNEPELIVERPVLDRLEPEIDQLAVCAVDLHAGFAAGLVSEENVSCIVSVARNMVSITEAAKG
ncbi:hypothetical protein [Pararhodobacter marinus]|uniref:hypothetical protein n=1 Tax=Pararhodobacter marinus TaxID=2184063 RepID=UPI0011B20D6C|nr:hypothetical protein [Pararhodobacter marinus]